MPKQLKHSKPLDARQLLSARPLTSTHFGNVSEIDAYLPSSGRWEAIATINSAGGIDAEDIASLIVSAINAYVEIQFRKELTDMPRPP